LRIGELILSKRNERWLIRNGAVEFGDKHYPFVVSLHILFFFSLIVEYSQQLTSAYSLLLIIIYVLIIALKAWVILSLGKFWNTKIYHIPNMPLIEKGPYKYFKHPNYAIVIAEIVIIPLAFHLYYTAIAFTLLNMLMLFIRIREENKVLNFQHQVESS
jgi:methyltransferase